MRFRKPLEKDKELFLLLLFSLVRNEHQAIFNRLLFNWWSSFHLLTLAHPNNLQIYIV